MPFLSTLASIGMAVGPPLVYSDQYINIIRRKDSTGFSTDVCGVLICANIIRVFFWFGKKFEIALLIQSILMIAFQLALLYVCIKYRKSALLPTHRQTRSNDVSNSATDLLASSAAVNVPLKLTIMCTLSLASLLLANPEPKWIRPYNFWQWESYGTYIEFIGALIGINTVLYIIFGWTTTYVDIIGLVALGLESTLPIPQLLSNFERKSLSGFRMTVLAGWVFGDAFKTMYFFLQAGNSWQFKATACFQLSIDFLICAQAYLYRHNTASDMLQAVPDEDLADVSREPDPRETIEIR